MRAVSRCVRLLTAALCLAWLPAVPADDSDTTVQAFFNELDTLQADFHQEVRDVDNTVQQVSDGKVWIQRPGRFRWDYASPYRQQQVSDGERLWSYDEDLEQVTVQPIGEVLSATPAMLLGGSQPLEVIFTVEPLSADGNREQVLLKSKSNFPASTKPSPTSSASRPTSNATKPPSSKPPSKASSPKNGAPHRDVQVSREGRSPERPRPTQTSNPPASFSTASSPNAAPSGKKPNWRRWKPKAKRRRTTSGRRSTRSPTRLK